MAAIAAVLSVFSAAAAVADYPERPITMIVAWSAGGGTDAVARALAARMEKELDVPITVVNRTGGAGVIGHTELVNARPDGYTIGLASIELSTYYWSGTAQFTAKDVTPIGLVNFDPSAVNVPMNSEWTDLRAVLDGIEAAPAGTYKLTGMAPGAGYHIAFSGLLAEEGIDPNKLIVIPTQGSQQGFQELAAGGADVQPSSLPEAKPMMDAGRVKSLAVLSRERLANGGFNRSSQRFQIGGCRETSTLLWKSPKSSCNLNQITSGKHGAVQFFWISIAVVRLH